MNVSLSPSDMLYLWSLASQGGAGEWLDPTASAIGDHRRDDLVAAGFIVVGGGHAGASRVSLTDPGWRYLQDHADAPLDAAAPAAAGVLQNLVLALARHTRDNELSLADLFTATDDGEEWRDGGPADLAVETREEAILLRIRAVGRRLASGGSGVRLVVLREEFPDLARFELDTALLALQRRGLIRLTALANPGEADVAAEIRGEGRGRQVVEWR